MYKKLKFSDLFMFISDNFWLKVPKIAKKMYLVFLLMFLETDKFSINIAIQPLR